MSVEQAATTRGFAKALGPFLILFGLGVGARADVMWALLPAYFQDNALVFVSAAFGLAIGCAMVAAHHHFGSLPALIVTLFGWVTLIRCALLLFAPQIVSSLASMAMHVPGLPIIPATVAVLIGVYLSFVGWFAKPRTIP